MNRRILILGPTAPSIGGITTAVNALLSSNLSKEFEMRLLANSNHRPVNKKGLLDAHNIASAFKIFIRLVWEIYSFRPKVVQVETAGRTGFLKQSVYILFAKLVRRKVIVSLHCANDGEPLMEFDTNSWALRSYCGWVLRMCHTVKLLSPRWRVDFSSRWGLDLERVIGVRNCLDTMYPWAAALSSSPQVDRFTIVCVGSVGERKGSFLLIEAVKRLRDAGLSVSLVLIGPEEQEGSMAALSDAACQYGVQDSVHLLGGQSREFALKELSKADVFALPSYAEGMPYSIIEALAIGCPVIASVVGAVKDLIKDGETGLLIQPGSAVQLADALSRLINDVSLRQKLALQGNQFARKEFGIHNLENAFRPVYERLINEQ